MAFWAKDSRSNADSDLSDTEATDVTNIDVHQPEEALPLTRNDEEEVVVWMPQVFPSDSELGQNHSENAECPNDQHKSPTEPDLQHIDLMDRPQCVSHLTFLNDEVEKLFVLPQKFDIGDLSTPSVPPVVADQGRRQSEAIITEKCHFDEDDYAVHRRVSYPHIHQPLRSLSSKSLKGLKPAKVKKKKKKKKKKVRSYPSRGAIQSPTILEEDEEDEDFDEDMTEGSEEGSEDEEQFMGEPSEESDDKKVAPLSLPSVQVGFFIGEEDIPSPVEEGRKVFPTSSSRSFSSVEAQKFKRSTSAEPEPSPMFFDLGEDPQPSQHAASLHVPNSQQSFGSRTSGESGSRVTFLVGGDASDARLEDKGRESPVWVPQQNGDVTDGSMKDTKPTDSQSDSKLAKSKHRHHHHHEHFKKEDLLLRRQKGSEVKLDNMEQLKRSPTETEEAMLLHKADLDEMASHRWEDVRGIRRHKIARHRSAFHSVVHIGKVAKEKKIHKPKKKFDHSPHEVFVELDELYMGDDAEWEWHEKARWIKFEEDVEEGAERWGKPHVASLSFHSLLELRRGLEQGTLLLDLEASDLQTIVHTVVENMVTRDQISEGDKGKILRTLLLKHKHQHSKSLIKSLSTSSFGSSVALNKAGKSDTTQDEKDHKTSKNMKEAAKLEMVKVDVDNNMTDGVHIGITAAEQSKKNVQDIMRRIPPGAEASTVLVGQVDFLEKPAIAFVRLAKGEVLENLTEVPLPTRFVIILLGPEKGGMDYHEVGRSISTLMANQIFHEVAYKAVSREELLHAINGFLDDSIVLPPGDWDQKTLLPIMDMARKRAHLRRRKKQKQEEKEALMEKEMKYKIPLDPLIRTGRPFGGLINDIKRRYPHYRSDFKDALNGQSVAALVFIFFACISPCIAFGGLLSEKTKGYMGVSETVLSTSLCGIVFGLFCGQPLLIVGATGPVLVFEQSLFKFCDSNGIEFLPFRCWIGMWVAIISIATVAAEGSFLVRYVTRFTEEIFAILISLIFIYEVVKTLHETFVQHPLMLSYCFDASDTENITGLITHSVTNSSVVSYPSSTPQPDVNSSTEHHHHKILVNQPNTALLSTILVIGTFLIAYFLRIFRNSKFLGRSARRALGDFGVLIAIFLMVLLDFVIKDTYTQKLSVGDSLSPTSPAKRGWFINPMGLEKRTKVWMIFAAIIPAFLIFILLFMEIQITEMILNKKERKLKKGSGFHLDQFIMGILTFVCALFGLPWMCAATVRTIAHVSALSVMSRTHAPGEKPKLLGVIEQRVTNIAVSLLTGVSLAFGPLLREIPMAVLFGVFLYLGVCSMSGVQMFERTKLLLMPVKHHPSVGYVRRVRTFKMYIFTIIQLLSLIVLWIVKSTQAALAFPFLLILLIPVRLKLLTRFFSASELHELDKEEEESDLDEEDEPDFYEQAHMPI